MGTEPQILEVYFQIWLISQHVAKFAVVIFVEL